jgi:hypothetical protein
MSRTTAGHDEPINGLMVVVFQQFAFGCSDYFCAARNFKHIVKPKADKAVKNAFDIRHVTELAVSAGAGSAILCLNLNISVIGSVVAIFA